MRRETLEELSDGGLRRVLRAVHRRGARLGRAILDRRRRPRLAGGRGTKREVGQMTKLSVGDVFPDFKLPDHGRRQRRLSAYTKPSPLDLRLCFDDGHPLILVFGRGFFCPRDQEQMRGPRPVPVGARGQLLQARQRNADSPMVGAAFRPGSGRSGLSSRTRSERSWTSLGILDETEGEYAGVSRPYTFVSGRISPSTKIYDGWFFVGRPTLEELRHDLREMMQHPQGLPASRRTTRLK